MDTTTEISVTDSTQILNIVKSVLSEELCILWEKHDIFGTACTYPKVHFPMWREVWFCLVCQSILLKGLLYLIFTTEKHC